MEVLRPRRVITAVLRPAYVILLALVASLQPASRAGGKFQGLGIPLPGLNAWVAASVECFGGLSLLAGFASRLTATPLSVTMIVAYLTADNAALKSIFSDTDKFTPATPFLFLLTTAVVLAFGPGAFSVDRLLARKFSPAPVNSKD